MTLHARHAVRVMTKFRSTPRRFKLTSYNGRRCVKMAATLRVCVALSLMLPLHVKTAWTSVSGGCETAHCDHHRQKRLSFPGWEQDTSKTALTATEISAIIMRHNDLRRQTSPSATNMIFLVWNEDLAAVAQTWAEGCDFQHNYANDYGENLSSQSSYYNVSIMVNNWFSESDNYDYNTHSCTGATCAHYTQVVLAESREFGCGMVFCLTMTTASMSNVYFLVCNYSPAVNKGSSVPFESGTPCSNCPAAYSLCDNSLCRPDPICDGLNCNNGGQLISELCACDCTGTGYNDTTCSGPGASSESPSIAPTTVETSSGISPSPSISPTNNETNVGISPGSGSIAMLSKSTMLAHLVWASVLCWSVRRYWAQ